MLGTDTMLAQVRIKKQLRTSYLEGFFLRRGGDRGEVAWRAWRLGISTTLLVGFGEDGLKGAP